MQLQLYLIHQFEWVTKSPIFLSDFHLYPNEDYFFELHGKSWNYIDFQDFQVACVRYNTRLWNAGQLGSF